MSRKTSGAKALKVAPTQHDEVMECCGVNMLPFSLKIFNQHKDLNDFFRKNVFVYLRSLGTHNTRKYLVNNRGAFSRFRESVPNMYVKCEIWLRIFILADPMFFLIFNARKIPSMQEKHM